jgi:hypothetical protein
VFGVGDACGDGLEGAGPTIDAGIDRLTTITAATAADDVCTVARFH